MSNRGERIKQYLEYKHIGPKEFGDHIQASKATVNHWFNNQSLTVDWLAKIADYYKDLNISWLLSGEGEMIKDSETPKKEKEDETTILKEKIKALEEINELLRENNRLLKKITD